MPAGAKGSPKKRVLLSLRVARQNAGYSADSLVEGLSLPACVRSAEDHGYTLTLGIKVASCAMPATSTCRQDASSGRRVVLAGQPCYK